jgi:pimeloyl-ACP methyl ester carboxylesterase
MGAVGGKLHRLLLKPLGSRRPCNHRDPSLFSRRDHLPSSLLGPQRPNFLARPGLQSGSSWTRNHWFVDDRTDFTDRLTEIRAPTLLVWSDADPISPPAVAHRLAGRIPNTRMVTVAGGSHAFANERPDEVASIIRSHLA